MNLTAKMNRELNEPATEVSTKRPIAESRTVTAREMCAEFLHELTHPRTRWGRWRLNRRHDTLEFHEADRGMLYEIDLADARRSSAACLDWIFQVSPKTWMTDKDRGDLLHAIQDTINPQGTLCSWGACRAGDECVKGEAELMSHSHYMRIDAPTAEIGRPV